MCHLQVLPLALKRVRQTTRTTIPEERSRAAVLLEAKEIRSSQKWRVRYQRCYEEKNRRNRVVDEKGKQNEIQSSAENGGLRAC